jgi:hypothetical protein
MVCKPNTPDGCVKAVAREFWGELFVGRSVNKLYIPKRLNSR